MKKTIPWLFAGLALSLSGGANAALFDRGGGLIYDDVLNVTWLQNANYGAGSTFDDGISSTDGLMTFGNTLAWVTNLSYFDSVRNVTYTDWRLPSVYPVHFVQDWRNYNFTYSTDGSTDHGYNISAPGSTYPGTTASELAFMYYQNLENKGYFDTQGIHLVGFGLVDDPSNPNDESLFINLQPDIYWAYNGYVIPELGAWEFSMYDGMQPNYAGGARYAWAVRDGDVAAVPEPEIYAMMLAGLGLVGAAARRQRGALIRRSLVRA